MTSTDLQQQLWLRYRNEPLPEITATAVIQQQLHHRSVRQFRDEPVDDQTLRTLIAAAQSASTSSNMQTWSVIAVRDSERKARLAELANEQDFINQAGVLLIWLVDYSRLLSQAAEEGIELPATEYLEAFMVGSIDAALAAQNALVAAESLGLGGCYIGAMRNQPDQVSQVLELPQHVFPIFGLIIGTPDPSERADVRPRLPQTAVLHHETYHPQQNEAALASYEGSLNEYFLQYGREHSWKQRNTWRLASVELMQGRDRLVKHVEDQGFTIR